MYNVDLFYQDSRQRRVRFKLSSYKSISRESDDNRRRLTQQDYYFYLLHYRTQSVKILHFAERLFQEFIVDAYAQIEQNRLRHLRLNQTQL